jgi:hypothetical protein
MSTGYAIAVSGLTKDDEKAFIEYLRSKRMLWWHWIDGFWLVIDKDGEVSISEIRDYLHAMSNSKRCLVIELDRDSDWSGFGASSQGESIFTWLKKTWPVSR